PAVPIRWVPGPNSQRQCNRNGRHPNHRSPERHQLTQCLFRGPPIEPGDRFARRIRSPLSDHPSGRRNPRSPVQGRLSLEARKAYDGLVPHFLPIRVPSPRTRMMHRRDLLRSGLVFGGALPVAESLAAELVQESKPAGLIIDCHCHAGKGEAMTAPWTSYADPQVTLRRAAEAGIDKTVIFPIHNPTYEKANQEIAGLVAKYTDRFIAFAK